MTTYTVRVSGRDHEARVQRGDGMVRVELDGRPYLVMVDRWLGSTHYRLTVNGTPRQVIVRRMAEAWLVAVGIEQYRVQVARTLPIPRRGATAASSTRSWQVTAPMPGLVVSVEVQLGGRVEQGRPVAVMEAMKMQMEIRAHAPGRVAAVHVRAGQEVAGGAALVTMEPSEPGMRHG